MTDAVVRERLAVVRERIAAAQMRAGLRHEVRIIAVTKGHSVAAVRAAAAAGLVDIGENRVQEALPKQDEAPSGLTWHLIGSLQRNKARQAVGRFGLIHSVDRLDLVDELARRVPAGGRQQVLVEVNCSGEAQKGGASPQDAGRVVDAVLARPSLECRGLMTMAALSDDREVQRTAFRRLRQVQDELQARGVPLPELSMGMSGDYETAVEEGATMVRLGTILFGERDR